MESLNGTNMNVTQASTGNRVASGVMGICFAIGIPGNVLTVILILRHFKRENFTFHLMLNLAASDILCLGTLPLWIYYLLHGWVFGPVMCKVLFTLGTLAMINSMMTVTLLSVQRYLMVMQRERWAKLGHDRERVLLFSLWMVAGLLSIPSAIWADTTEENSRTQCKRIPTLNGITVTILFFEFLLGFAMPFSIMVGSYCRLYMDVNKGAFFKHRRLTRLVIRIVVAFFIFSSPVYLLYLVEIVAIAIRQSQPRLSEEIMKFYRKCANVAVSLIFINSCVNPLLYAFSSRKLFRRAEKAAKPNSWD